MLCASGTRLAPTGVDTETAEQSVVIIKSMLLTRRKEINYEIRQIFKGVPLNQAAHRGK